MCHSCSFHVHCSRSCKQLSMIRRQIPRCIRKCQYQCTCLHHCSCHFQDTLSSGSNHRCNLQYTCIHYRRIDRPGRSSYVGRMQSHTQHHQSRSRRNKYQKHIHPCRCTLKGTAFGNLDHQSLTHNYTRHRCTCHGHCSLQGIP